MKNRFSVGRDLGADVPIADASVSRRHAELSPVDGGRLFVTDCKSSNGTFLVRDGVTRPLSQETVLPTDHVKFGEVTIAVSALLDAIRQKPGAAAVAADARGAAQPPAPPTPARPSDAKLVRCDCGAVKPHNGSCPECGQ